MRKDIAVKKAKLEKIKAKLEQYRQLYTKAGIEGSAEQATMDELEQQIQEGLDLIAAQQTEAPEEDNSSSTLLKSGLEGLKDLRDRLAAFMNTHNII